MADHDRIEGSAKNMGGKIKEGAGKLTGDSKLQAEGKADQVEGKVQNAVGGVKDSLKDRTPSAKAGGVSVWADPVFSRPCRPKDVATDPCFWPHRPAGTRS